MSNPKRRRGNTRRGKHTGTTQWVTHEHGLPYSYLHRDESNARNWQHIMRQCGLKWVRYRLGTNLIHNGGRPRKP